MGKGEIVFFIIVLNLFFGCSSLKQNDEPLNKISSVDETIYAKQINFISHWQGQGMREKIVTDAIRNFEFRHQDTKINMVNPEDTYMDGSIEHVEERFIIETVSAPIPEWDIIRLNGKYYDVAKYANDLDWAKKYLVDFSEIEAFRYSTLPELLSEEVKANYGGIIPGPFIEGQYWSLWFNKKVADKVGIEIKQQAMTMHDFESYIKAVSDYNSSHPDDYIVPLGEGSDWRTSWLLPFQLYASLFTNKNDLLAGGIQESKLEKWHQVLMAMESLSTLNLYDNRNGSKPWNEVSENLLNAKSLFYLNGSWMYNIWNNSDAEKTLSCFPAELPAFEQNTIYPMGYVVTWAVPKNAPNKDEAIEFLLSMNTADLADSWVKYTKSPTGIKGNMTDVNFGVDQYELFSNYINDKYAKSNYSSRTDNSFIFGLKNAYNETYVGAVLNGELTADEAMVKIRSELVYELVD